MLLGCLKVLKFQSHICSNVPWDMDIKSIDSIIDFGKMVCCNFALHEHIELTLKLQVDLWHKMKQLLNAILAWYGYV